jgi:hypothetical protein
MDKGYYAVLIIILVLVVVAAIFYTNPYENHRQIAIGICELECHHLITNSTLTSNTCIKENVSFGYSCAAINPSTSTICTNTNEINLNYNCALQNIK